VAVLGGVLLLTGIIANEVVLARYFSADGSLEASTTFSIRLLQATLTASGLALLLRKRIAWLVLLLSLVVLNLAALREKIASSTSYETRITDAQLQELRAFLPTRGRVGYISDEVPFSPTWKSSSRRRYYRTQYAVAPVVVQAGAAPGLIIGDFRSVDHHSIAGLDVVHDFGGGLFLFRKRPE
jgi:hypothetical protein